MTAALRIGTRGSALARIQAAWVRDRIGARLPAELVEIRTTGDRVQDVPLSAVEGKAFFTRELDEALLDGRIDLAVHSLKDLPTELPDGVELAAVSPREDARDALVGRGPLRWAELPRGAAVATSSVRRRAQLLRSRPDLTVVDIRGNVDTRLARLQANPDWSATVLAVAGLVRLGLEARIGERLAPEVMLPAPGQGALAVTARRGDAARLALLRAEVHHHPTALAVAAERAVLLGLEGGCQAPIGAWGDPMAEGVRLTARLVSPDGRESVEASLMEPVAEEAAAAELGLALAARLRRQGGDGILARIRAQRSSAGYADA
jgi:hydroxymethylbilane synthase